MTAGKLAQLKLACCVGEMPAQIRFELGEIKFFAGSNCGRMVQQIAHSILSLAIGEHCGIYDVRMNIEAAERKPLGVI